MSRKFLGFNISNRVSVGVVKGRHLVRYVRYSVGRFVVDHRVVLSVPERVAPVLTSRLRHFHAFTFRAGALLFHRLVIVRDDKWFLVCNGDYDVSRNTSDRAGRHDRGDAVYECYNRHRNGTRRSSRLPRSLLARTLCAGDSDGLTTTVRYGRLKGVHCDKSRHDYGIHSQ